jgi:hypothetical protein
MGADPRYPNEHWEGRDVNNQTRNAISLLPNPRKTNYSKCQHTSSEAQTGGRIRRWVGCGSCTHLEWVTLLIGRTFWISDPAPLILDHQ